MSMFRCDASIFVEALDAQIADAWFESMMRALLQSGAQDWTRAGACYPVPATRAELKAVAYFRDNPEERNA